MDDHPPADFRLLSLVSPSEARSARDNLGLRGYGDLLRHVVDERMFDWRYGVRTNYLVPTPGLGFGDADVQAEAQRYRATPPYGIGRAMDWLARDQGGLGDHCLVDYGCGAGRVLILAAKAGFGAAIGLELSPSLVSMARDNIEARQRRAPVTTDVTVIETNAAQYVPPAHATVFYFFHPFSAAYFRTSLSGIRASVRAAPRDIYLLLFQSGRFQTPGLHPIARITGVTILSNRAEPDAFLTAE